MLLKALFLNSSLSIEIGCVCGDSSHWSELFCRISPVGLRAESTLHHDSLSVRFCILATCVPTNTLNLQESDCSQLSTAVESVQNVKWRMERVDSSSSFSHSLLSPTVPLSAPHTAPGEGWIVVCFVSFAATRERAVRNETSTLSV